MGVQAVNEEDQQTEPVVEHACILLDATERLLSNATHWLKHALSRAAAASEKAAGNESAHKRWQSFVDAMEAGRVKHQEGKDELCQSERASEEGSPSNDEGQVRPEEIESVTWESQAGTKGPAKQLKGVFSRGSTGGQKSPGEDRKAHTVSPEEESQLNEQAAALVSSLASLCQLPVVLRKAVQALRPLLKIARPVSALESAAFALSSMYLAWGRLEPALVGEMLIDRPWFAAFVPPRREKLLSVSWRESGILELFEILEFRAETAEKWTATPEDLRHQVGIAVHAWASLSSTFSVDALELLALEGLPHVPSGVAAGLRVMLCEPDPEARQMWTEAIRLLAERYPRALSRGFAGTSLQELVSRLLVGPSQKGLRMLPGLCARFDNDFDISAALTWCSAILPESTMSCR